MYLYNKGPEVLTNYQLMVMPLMARRWPELNPLLPNCLRLLPLLLYQRHPPRQQPWVLKRHRNWTYRSKPSRLRVFSPSGRIRRWYDASPSRFVTSPFTGNTDFRSIFPINKFSWTLWWTAIHGNLSVSQRLGFCLRRIFCLPSESWADFSLSL